MNIKTFYTIYYRHRIQKANLLLKIYILLILPIRYLLNIPFLPKKINLDEHSNSNVELFKKDLDYLFEYFNSDKGNYYINQYMQPIKKKNKRIDAHGYSKIYERYFEKIRNANLNVLELGSFYGNAAGAFFYYFKNSSIYSGDICPDLFRYKSQRLKNFYINTSSEISIKKNLIDNQRIFNVIIEDASHTLKDQIISLFMLFKILSPKGIFICEELDFPETRKDMNINNEYPDLKNILKAIKLNKDFNSKYIKEEDKKYFLDNFNTIEIFKGKINEVAVIQKK
ncbi:MAG: hypothetical protein EVA74_01145 [Candidatus Pelagibacterales bacterium]|nr:MAG: hypothetical protein EVA74_01145 [Pelagibacterales bacterium]